MKTCMRCTEVAVALGVVAFHAWALHLLAGVELRTLAHAGRLAPEATALLAEFIPVPPKRARTPITATNARTRSEAPPTAVAATQGAPARRSADDSLAVETTSAGGRAQALDLSVRERPDPFPAAVHSGAFARPPPLDARTTRFEQAWIPAGTAVDQARFRSQAVRLALGLFGGPPRRCDEVERRLRRVDCLPADEDEVEREALMRALAE